METQVEKLQINCSLEHTETSLSTFINNLDASKKRKQVIRSLQDEQSNTEFFTLLQKWLYKRLVALDITIAKRVSSLLEISDASQMLLSKVSSP